MWLLPSHDTAVTARCCHNPAECLPVAVLRVIPRRRLVLVLLLLHMLHL